jgi:DNA-binding NarL/FixJ family response regulator
MGVIRAVVVEDFPVTREAVVAILKSDPRISVVASVADAHNAIAAIHDLAPDVVLLDLALPYGSGEEVVTWIGEYAPLTRAVVFSGDDTSNAARRLLDLGAVAYVSKRSPPAELIRTIVEAADGKREVVVGVDGGAGESDGLVKALRPREREVLRLLCAGLSDKEIARRLHISVRTVQNHLAHARDQLGLRRRGELIRWAVDRGLAGELDLSGS